AIGSVVICVYLRKWFFNIFETFLQLKFYQLAFLTPGINPLFAISLKVTREIPNVLIYPRGLPVNLQRLCKRTGEAFFGNFCSPSKSPASVKAFLFSAYFFTVSCLFTSRAFIDSLAIINSFLREI